MSEHASSPSPSDSPKSGLEFLEELETRHSYVLDELDSLNARIEKVLDEYQQSRKQTQSAPANADSGTVASEQAAAEKKAA